MAPPARLHSVECLAAAAALRRHAAPFGASRAARCLSRASRRCSVSAALDTRRPPAPPLPRHSPSPPADANALSLPPAVASRPAKPPPLSTWATAEEAEEEEEADERRATDYPTAAAVSWASRPAKPRPPPPPEPLPSDGWDPLWLPSRKRLALSLFPAWVRPAWWPDWADPFDASSDLRRWIFPYLVAPYVCVQVLKWTLIAPVFAAELATSPGGGSGAFALRPEQTEKCEAEAERYRAHLSFEQLMQRAPPLAEADLLAAVRAKLAADEAACAEENCRASTELAADATFTTAGVANVFLNRRSVQTVQISVSKEFFALDSSKQAFLLLLVSDILVGYHSSEGWATALQLVANHYGLQESKDLTALFIAVVPVSLDVLFKFWCFKKLRELSPDTQVILSEIDS